MDIVALFYDLDKFAIAFEPQWKRRLLPDGKRHRHRQSRMHLSEIMTILILFHASNYRTFKHFYLDYVRQHLRGEFPRLLSYNRFVERIPQAFAALVCYLKTRMAPCSGISFIDSIPARRESATTCGFSATAPWPASPSAARPLLDGSSVSSCI